MEASKQEKTIKDYLHLYLGQECRCYSTWDTDGWKETVTPDLLLEVSDEDSRIGGLRLVLRRLSSITDDEIKELFHWEKVRHEYKDISFDRWTVENRTTGVITLTGITMNYTIPTDEGDHARSYTIEVSGMNAYDFKWCLSKGFDLFGLIDGGLAIQKPLPL